MSATEYIDEFVCGVSGVDHNEWESIPQYTKTDLVVGRHLGKVRTPSFLLLYSVISADCSFCVLHDINRATTAMCLKCLLT